MMDKSVLFINGNPYIRDLNMVVSECFQRLNPYYMPMGVLRRESLEICTMVKDHCIDKKKWLIQNCNKYYFKREVSGIRAKLTRMIKKMIALYDLFRGVQRRDDFIKKYFSVILAFEGMSPLRGFGLAKMIGRKVSSHFRINPEIQSIASDTGY
jgi:hypothetical protein